MIREIVALGEDLKRGVRNVKEVVLFDEEELTEDVVQARVRATAYPKLNLSLRVLEEVGSHGRCVIVLPDERRVALYAVHPEEGASEVVWYERTELLGQTTPTGTRGR